MAAFQAVSQDPSKISQYENNPKVKRVIEKLSSRFGGGAGGMGGMPGGMGGMPGGMGGMPGGMGGMPGGMGGMPPGAGSSPGGDDLD